VSRLTVGDTHNEEVGLELLHVLSFRDNRWHHFVLIGSSHDHLLARIRITEHVVTLESLSLIRDHVALNTDVVVFRLDDNSDKLGHFEAHWVVVLVLLLKFSGSSSFVRSQETVLVDFGKDLADQLEAESVSDHVDDVALGVLKLSKSVNLANLRWLVHRFDVDAHTFREVGVFRVVSEHVSDSLLKISTPLPVTNET